MIGQGLGPGGSFSLWNRRGLCLKKKSKAASHAMAKTAAQEVSSIGEDFGGCSGERVRVVWGGLNLRVIMKSFIFIAVLYLKHELHME